MVEEPRFVYLTRPTNDLYVLNVVINKQHTRYAVNREQLFTLNRAIVEILTNSQSDEDSQQLLLQLEESAKL